CKTQVLWESKRREPTGTTRSRPVTSPRHKKSGTPKFPSLDKEGWLRASADGVVEPTTPSAPIKGSWRDIFLMSRPPLLIQGGEVALPTLAQLPEIGRFTSVRAAIVESCSALSI